MPKKLTAADMTDSGQGTYASFHYGVENGFIVFQGDVDFRFRMSRVTFDEFGNMGLVFVGFYDSIKDARQGAADSLNTLFGLTEKAPEAHAR